MGSCKQLLPLDGQTVIARSLETLFAGGIEEVIVVVGPNGGQVARAVRNYPVQVRQNSDPEGDMAVSVCTGREALSEAVTAVVVALCDYPLVKGTTINALIEAHRRYPQRVVIPSHNGRRGHPALFPRQLLEALRPPLTLRDLLHRYRGRIEHLTVPDPGVLIDMDTPDDYRRVLERCAQERRPSVAVP